jgi:DNA-binding LacI/PurR family transcriptional regulator
VLNGGYASPDVKARVARVIAELGYSPSPTARNLKMGRTGILGVVAEMSQGAWFTELLSGVQEGLAHRDYGVILGSVAPGGCYEPQIIERWIVERRVDGLIFARPGKREAPLVDAALKAGLPLAYVSPEQTFAQGYVVSVHNYHAGELAAQHLSDLGHKRVGFIATHGASLTVEARFKGFVAGLHSRGMSFDRSHHFVVDAPSDEAGALHARRWLELPRGSAPSGIVAADDSIALGFMRSVQQAGLSVPEDVSIVGFEGLPETTLCWPGLTTVAQPTREMGKDACQRVLELIDDEPPAIDGSTYEMELISRESSASPHRATQIPLSAERVAG